MASGKIGFQGAQGANSEIAIREVYPSMQAVPCDTFEDVFNALAAKEIDLAMIPIENSLAGRVADIHHLLPESGTYIVGEYFLPIRFDLMALPGVSIDEIETVYSHVHGLGQCRKIIRKHGWKAEVGGDTAGSAKLVSQRADRKIAALAPALAAEIYGLDTLASNVEDAEHNTTRFVILSRDARWAEPGNGPVITTFLFQVRNIPAALYKAMGGFATNGVNMTKLESYQIGGAFTATQFYADIEGHPEDVSVKNALEEIKFFCKEFKILGVYPAGKAREEVIGERMVDY
ncbi:MAG: prephenate dehydratase [Pseudomonadota bacterium]